MTATRRRWKVSALPDARRRQRHQKLFSTEEFLNIVSCYLADEDQRDAKCLARKVLLPMRSAKFVNKLPGRSDRLGRRLRCIQIYNVMEPLSWHPSVETMTICKSSMPCIHEPWVSLKTLIIEQSEYNFKIDPRHFPNLDILDIHMCVNLNVDIRNF